MTGRPRKCSKEELIEKAMNEFWARGYEACSTDHLCRKIGVGKGSFYNAFETKHALYVETLKYYHELWLEEQIALLSQPIALKQRLENLLNWAVAVDFGDQRQGCYLINAAIERGKTDEAVVHWTKKHVDVLGQKIQMEIQRSIDEKELNTAKTATELTTMFLTSYYGLRTLNASVQSEEMAKMIVANAMAAF